LLKASLTSFERGETISPLSSLPVGRPETVGEVLDFEEVEGQAERVRQLPELGRAQARFAGLEPPQDPLAKLGVWIKTRRQFSKRDVSKNPCGAEPASQLVLWWQSSHGRTLPLNTVDSKP
jgi:hypothetical protein